ncbi:MAG: hypothetical protein AB7J13_01030 [Pyrinomonadaceae bacterium]
MSRTAFVRWERLRMKGKTYVVIHTAVISGIFFFLVLNAISWFWRGNSISTSFFFIFPAIGIVAGLLRWSVNEIRFSKFLVDKKLRATKGPK